MIESKPIYSSDELIARATAIASEGRKKKVAVAAAQDVDVIGAIVQARNEGFLDALLTGDETAIRRMADEAEIDIDGVEIMDEKDPLQAAHRAVKEAAEGRADAIMKGFLPTSALLKVVLDKKYNLRGPNALSHCAVLDIPGYHKLLNFTDGGMIVKPTQEQKFEVLENGVIVGRALGLSPVKVAISAATDHMDARMPHTLSDADGIIPKAMEKLADIVIQGPLTLDLATSKIVAEKCGKAGAVVGDADIFLVDSIEEGNIISKTLVQFAEAVFAGVIVGAKVPISLVSRTDNVKNKKASLALACVLADYQSQNPVGEN